MLLMTNQFITTQQLGYWASKAIFAPDSTPAVWTRPNIQLYVWLRSIGDVVAGTGIAVFLIHMLRALPRAKRKKTQKTFSSCGGSPYLPISSSYGPRSLAP
jgi:nitric oxide reductase large subunit